MTSKLKQIIWLLTGILITGCSTQVIYIKKDGTASVEIDLFDIIDENKSNSNEKGTKLLAVDDTGLNKDSLGDYRKSIRELYSSDVITNFTIDTTANEVIKFDVKYVDSLGIYLDPLFGTFFEFELTDDRLLIIGPDGNSDPEDDITGLTNMIPVYALLKFEKTIKNIVTKNKYVKKIDNHTIEIKTSIGEMNYNGIGNKVEIFLE